MESQFWAVGCGLGWLVGKKVWADYEQLLRPVFSLFRGQKFFFFLIFKNILATALRSYIILFLQKHFLLIF